jgi:hypothetical protein
MLRGAEKTKMAGVAIENGTQYLANTGVELHGYINPLGL